MINSIVTSLGATEIGLASYLLLRGDKKVTKQTNTMNENRDS